MRAADFLRNIRDKKTVAPDDMRAFVQGISNGTVADYQATAFCMAVFLQGLPDDLTVALTLAMRDSGRVLDLSDIPGPKVDKHSTGGVGDKISIPLAPLVASCGVVVPMVSGRGLGHTGGTLDKLESIPGFRVNLDIPEFKSIVEKLGVCLIGQTDDIAPADRKLYALRDVTATVESIPLITGSILSKKLAEGIDALVLDVKVGRGAFMKTESDARHLAKALVRVGTGAGLKVRAVLTHMDGPLGAMIGNALEIKESLEILQGTGPKDTTELTLHLGAEMLCAGGIEKDLDVAKKKLAQALSSGQALTKFQKIIELQHGDPHVVEDPKRLPTAKHVLEVCAKNKGYVQSVDAFQLGTAAMQIGAGRSQAEDTIDPAVGIQMLVKPGYLVDANQPMALVHHNGNGESINPSVQQAFAIANEPTEVQSLILGRMG